MLRSILIVALVLAAPTAAAQGAVYFSAADMSGSTNTIRYSATDVMPAEGKAYSAFGQGGTTYATAFDYKVLGALSPGAIEVKASMSCERPTVYRPDTTSDVRRPTATAALMKGTTTIASASLGSLRTCDGPDDVWEAVFPMDASAGTFVAGDTLTIQMSVWWLTPPPGPAQNAYFIVGGAKASGAFGPGLPGDPALVVPDVIMADLNGTIDHSFDEATSRSYRFEYNASGSQNITFNTTINGGSVFVEILDADGTSLFNATEGAFTGVLNGTAGNWTINIDYTDFAGHLTLGLSPFVAPSEPGTGTGTNTATGTNATTTDGPDGNGTANPGEKSPGLPIILVLAALFLVRRRQ